ncbi:MAG TPA: GTP 3',8-cyclase MoaA [Lachnospiraceae bacterium]|nr:GTP 3',8-cyclase MoaA [Lachnospiraceae bacterium]
MLDRYNRDINYVRISVTDKCNLRCRYCMPEDIKHLPMSEILTFEEICKAVSTMAELGISRVKLNGGEPLIRRGIEELVRSIKAIPGIEQVTMTTNGTLLPEKLDGLLSAGLDMINVSLDTLDRQRYEKLTGFDALDKALLGIDKVLEAGLPLHINAVSYDSSILGEEGLDPLEDTLKLIDFVRDKQVDIRFIELMPLGFAKGFPAIPHDILRKRIEEKYPEIEKLDGVRGNGPAVYYHIPGFKGRIGFISAMHEGYCADCNRIRLTTRGFIKSCLCFDTGGDIKAILRDDIPEDVKEQRLKDRITEAILKKPQKHCFYDEKNITETDAMSAIGG